MATLNPKQPHQDGDSLLAQAGENMTPTLQYVPSGGMAKSHCSKNVQLYRKFGEKALCAFCGIQASDCCINAGVR